VVEGNDAIVSGLAERLPQPVRLGHRLRRVARQADGRVRLTFDTDGGSLDTVHDAVVLTLPAPAMRQVEFAASVALPASKRFAIERLDYGTNSKMMVGFRGRPWYERCNSNGASYSDLANHQSTWEANPSRSLPGVRGVITDYSGGARGAALNPSRTQAEAEAFLRDLDRVWPGSAGLALRDGRTVRAVVRNWTQDPLFGGAYTNNQPGYFTTLEGLYAPPVGNVFFAGEHTDSFYEYQGFMEGALRSGARAADEVLRSL
jgi:monoamine oxidase